MFGLLTEINEFTPKTRAVASARLLPMLLMIALTAACGKQPSTSSVEGWPAATTAQVKRPYILYRAAPNIAGLSDFIQESQPALDAEQADLLAKNIMTVAACFEIDARILTSQIRQESLFDARAESSTRAAGLSQLTRIGIKEVEHQLGAMGPSQAGALAIQYFNGVVNGCLASKFGADFPARTHLWKRVESGSAAEDLREKKQIIMAEPRIALVYGAILLKTLLSKSRLENTTWTTKEVYGRALWYYNGDPAAQQHYRDVILSKAATIH